MEVANNNMSWYDTIDRIDAQAFQDAQSMKGFYIGNGQSSIGMLKDSLLRQLKWPNADDQYAAFGSGKECCRLIREQCNKSKAETLNDGEITSCGTNSSNSNEIMELFALLYMILSYLRIKPLKQSQVEFPDKVQIHLTIAQC